MNFDTIATISLIVILTILVFYHRKKLSFHRTGIFYAAMYRTQTGIETMNKLGQKHKNLWIKLTPYIIATGFIGMALVTFDLIRSLIKILSDTAAPTVGLVLPIQAKGVFYVPFVYWIISIFVILIIHEGMHGVMARAYGLKVRNSGLVILGILIPLIPGAFVEPDEKKLIRAPRKQQLAVYAAGPVANIATGILLIMLSSLIINPYVDTFYAKDGVVVTQLMDGHPPAEKAGIDIGEKITQINGQAIKETTDFSTALQGTKPGDQINVVTATAIYDLTLGENPTNQKAWLGIYVEDPLKAPNWATHTVLWLKDLVFWLYLLSLGVGLFNLIPLGPIDGGRMFLTVLQKYTPHSHTIWKSVSYTILGVLITNIVMAFV